MVLYTLALIGLIVVVSLVVYGAFTLFKKQDVDDDKSEDHIIKPSDKDKK